MIKQKAAEKITKNFEIKEIETTEDAEQFFEEVPFAERVKYLKAKKIDWTSEEFRNKAKLDLVMSEFTEEFRNKAKLDLPEFIKENTEKIVTFAMLGYKETQHIISNIPELDSEFLVAIMQEILKAEEPFASPADESDLIKAISKVISAECIKTH